MKTLVIFFVGLAFLILLGSFASGGASEGFRAIFWMHVILFYFGGIVYFAGMIIKSFKSLKRKLFGDNSVAKTDAELAEEAEEAQRKAQEAQITAEYADAAERTQAAEAAAIDAEDQNEASDPTPVVEEAVLESVQEANLEPDPIFESW